MATMIDRMKRAAMLDVKLYQEVEEDASLNQEALIVVVLASLAGAIGAFIGGIIGAGIGKALLGAVASVVLGVLSYYVWAYVTYFVGTNLFKGTADVGELLRTLGYAHTPRLLSVLSFIPCVGPIVSAAGAILSLVAAVIAVREALDFDTGKAAVTCIIGWVLILIINVVLGLVLGIGAVGFGAITSAFGGG